MRALPIARAVIWMVGRRAMLGTPSCGGVDGQGTAILSTKRRVCERVLHAVVVMPASRSPRGFDQQNARVVGSGIWIMNSLACRN
jgi:hypothetical protein